jgi:hypothetical protein
MAPPNGLHLIGVFFSIFPYILLPTNSLTPLRLRQLVLSPYQGATLPLNWYDMSMVYMSPDPYHEAFEQTLDLHKFDFSHHCTAGLSLFEQDGWVHLGMISLSTPAAKLHERQSCV